LKENEMKFRSPTGTDIHVALTSGQTANVTTEGVELDPIFHREAIVRGCVPGTLADADQAALDGTPADPAFNRKETIAKALQAMLDGTNAEDFKQDGTPNLNRVSKRVGFQANRDEVAEVWAEISAENAG
jgi:hypothetical protein